MQKLSAFLFLSPVFILSAAFAYIGPVEFKDGHYIACGEGSKSLHVSSLILETVNSMDEIDKCSPEWRDLIMNAIRKEAGKGNICQKSVYSEERALKQSCLFVFKEMLYKDRPYWLIPFYKPEHDYYKKEYLKNKTKAQKQTEVRRKKLIETKLEKELKQFLEEAASAEQKSNGAGRQAPASKNTKSAASKQAQTTVVRKDKTRREHETQLMIETMNELPHKSLVDIAGDIGHETASVIPCFSEYRKAFQSAAERKVKKGSLSQTTLDEWLQMHDRCRKGGRFRLLLTSHSPAEEQAGRATISEAWNEVAPVVLCSPEFRKELVRPQAKKQGKLSQKLLDRGRRKLDDCPAVLKARGGAVRSFNTFFKTRKEEAQVILAGSETWAINLYRTACSPEFRKELLDSLDEKVNRGNLSQKTSDHALQEFDSICKFRERAKFLKPGLEERLAMGRAINKISLRAGMFLYSDFIDGCSPEYRKDLLQFLEQKVKQGNLSQEASDREIRRKDNSCAFFKGYKEGKEKGCEDGKDRKYEDGKYGDRKEEKDDYKKEEKGYKEGYRAGYKEGMNFNYNQLNSLRLCRERGGTGCYSAYGDKTCKSDRI